MRALLHEVRATGARIVIPAGVIGQVWRTPATQMAIGSVTRAAETTVVSLDKVMAEAAGVLCGRKKVADVIDATVVLTARREGAAVIVTSDVDDLRHLDPSAELFAI